MKTSKTILFILLVVCYGCGQPGKTSIELSKNEMLELQHQQQKKHYSVKPPLTISQGRYLGGNKIALKDELLPPVFDREITFNKDSSTLQQLTKGISNFSGLQVRIAAKTQSPETGGGGTSPFETTQSKPGAIILETSHTGSLKDLLDIIASRTGMSWKFIGDYIYIYHYRTKTYTLITTVGDVVSSSSVSNDTSTSGGEGSDTTISGSQVTSLHSKFSVWADTIKSIKSMLSPAGRVVANTSTGTISVTDTETTLTAIDQYVSQINKKLGQQVAITIKVYGYITNDFANQEINLNILFENIKKEWGFEIKSGNPINTRQGSGNLTAVILDTAGIESESLGRFSGSTAILKALRQQGDVRLITSGSGIILNNQPMPIQNVKRNGYLASVKTSTSDSFVETELQQEEVTTGFSMLVTPHILKNNKILLQYSINLSTLDALKEVSSGGHTIQIPEVSTRSFMQRVVLQSGATLLLAGFEHAKDITKSGYSIIGYGQKGESQRSVIIIAITANEVSGVFV